MDPATFAASVLRSLRTAPRRSAATYMGAAAFVAGGVYGGGVDSVVGFLTPGLEAEPANPLIGTTFFVDPDSHARQQANAWRSSRPEDAEAMEVIARSPQADWFGDWNRDIEGDVKRRVAKARKSGAVPVVVAYNIPARDCGLHSAGGADGAKAYQRWIRSFAEGLGKAPTVVVLEPDAVAGADCLSERDQDQRMALVADAVKELKRRSGALVYIDAGNPGWKSVGTMAERLRRAGIADADGFALNVSNTVDTGRNIEYGERLSAALDGAHFVIDTSRNGLGAPADAEWCNPPGRALGQAPTFDTGHGLVDAFLWVKRPGESDGECNGGPRAGAWWPDYALELALRA